jgi:arsenate reductase
MKILILCTGNSARSQMAEGFLKSFDTAITVESAGTYPARQVHPFAVKVMSEVNIDISSNRPKNVDNFLNESFDYVITVCDNAKESCPIFRGKVHQQLHLAFDDPAEASGTDEYVLSEFRRIRDEIRLTFNNFYRSTLAPQLSQF